jgi:hypothetical protein
MFIQIKALPPSERPQGQGIHPEMEVLYVSDKPHLDRDVFYTLEDLMSAGDDVVITADHSQELEQHQHTEKVSYWGYDGLLYLSYMAPRSNPDQPMPKWEELVSPTA